MRRDTYIENDSGGLSVLVHDAIDDIVEDQRANDIQFVTSFKALLLELYGDDSMPVRIVVDEPLQRDEEEQWLAKASWRLDATSGRLVVMGGFDPDVLAWWKEATGGYSDGRGVALVEVPVGSLRVDLYAHVGSMNGRKILSEADEKLGAAFRRAHPDRPFPLWLAHMLDHDDRDPGFDALWKDVKQSVQAGGLAIETDGPAAIGFVVHVQRLREPVGDAPDSGWFALDTNARVPKVFPLGLASNAIDPGMEAFRDRILGRKRPEPPPPIVTRKVDVISVWDGDPLQPIRDNAAPLTLALPDAYWLHWIASLTADSPPAFEIWVAPFGGWEGPEPTPEFAVESKPGAITAIGPSPDNGGWWLMWAARSAATAITNVPDGSTIDLATASRPEGDDANRAIGRMRYRGVVGNRLLALTDASPAIDRATLADALDFMHALTIDHEIPVRSAAERIALEQAAAIYASGAGEIEWKAEAVRVKDNEQRTLIILASAVFRARFGHQWACDVEDEDD